MAFNFWSQPWVFSSPRKPLSHGCQNTNSFAKANGMIQVYSYGISYNRWNISFCFAGSGSCSTASRRRSYSGSLTRLAFHPMSV